MLAVYFAQHLADLAAMRKRLLDVDTLRFLEVNIDNHPVSVSSGLEIIKVDALEPQEFENLIFVNILRLVLIDILTFFLAIFPLLVRNYFVALKVN